MIREGLLFLTLLAAPTVPAATITIVNSDEDGVGFNDPTPRAPVGLNTGTTLGEQRMIVYQKAAEILGAYLVSDVPIVVDAGYAPLTCSTSGATLGSASPTYAFQDVDGAPRSDVWYPSALAESFAGVDLTEGDADIRARFNLSIDEGCYSRTWYYGMDGAPAANQVDFLAVILHEICHGLGNTVFLNRSTGELFKGDGEIGYPSAYETNLFDRRQDLLWTDMNPRQRRESFITNQLVVWEGASIRNAAPRLLRPTLKLSVISPQEISGELPASGALFSAPVPAAGVSGRLVFVNDGVGCSMPQNFPPGAIALIDRGLCTYGQKAELAEAAGAAAVVIVSNFNQFGLLDLGGTTKATIPVVGVSLETGNRLKDLLNVDYVGRCPGAILSNGGFEDGAQQTAWQFAGSTGRTPYPFEAQVYAMRGMTALFADGMEDVAETQSASQTLPFPAGSLQLRFFVSAQDAVPGDSIRVWVDDTSFGERALDALIPNTYMEHSVDVSHFADGEAHTLKLEFVFAGHAEPTYASIDEVCLATGKVPTPNPDGITVRIENGGYRGADSKGRAMIYTPANYIGGSSLTHWDTSASPNLLMEPNINFDLDTQHLDITLQGLRDLGWKVTGIPGDVLPVWMIK